MRGTRFIVTSALIKSRFIPAGAGNTSALFRSILRISVHPRGCGEHFSTTSTPSDSTGSSPRVRGTRARFPGRGGVFRFIPAGAGNTSTFSRALRTASVHPRGCGEHGICGTTAFPSAGSSPRVRGTLFRISTKPFLYRFIPAGAGNTRLIVESLPHMTVHPRGCGEHDKAWSSRGPRFGSSPRVRGTLRPTPTLSENNRFIPAGAGNTVTDSANPPSASVHPRGCGEHQSIQFLPHTAPGSSPRVRGTRHWVFQDAPSRRFIPAGAGNTLGAGSSLGGFPVHPRGCGEHF